MDAETIKNKWSRLEGQAKFWETQLTQSSNWSSRLKRKIMEHETKVQLGVAFVCAAVGYAAAPKVLEGFLKVTRLLQKICDKAVKETI